MADIRDALFADGSLSSWVTEARPQSEPWATFARARDAQAGGRVKDAVDALSTIAATPGLESRHYIAAWNALRALGVQAPDAIAKRVDGVVVEVAMDGGLDVLAAYADRRARYINYSGAAVIWEAPDSRFDAILNALLAAGSVIAQRIGPWEGARRLTLAPDNVRLSLLTPSGLHFGEGPMNVLMNDAMASPFLRAAIALLEGLTSLQR